jgi:SET domain-containing protein
MNKRPGKHYRPLPKSLHLGPSEIEGYGIFASEHIPAGTNLGLTHIPFESQPNGMLRTPLGGFYNHSDAPNCQVIQEKGIYPRFCMYLHTLVEVRKGEELTVKYRLYDPTV